MEHVIYIFLFVMFAVVALLAWRREHGLAVTAKGEKDAIEVEERRMFNFLHGLGETLQKDNSPSSMHRYIVDGVMDVVGAEAGILYLLDGETKHLVVVYQSSGVVVPVLRTPEEIAAIPDFEDREHQYRTFVRLSALEKSDPLIGRIIRKVEHLSVDDLSKFEGFEGADDEFQKGVSFMGSPLIYGRKKVGVIAVTRSGNRPFSRNDKEVFESVSEQSSFALGGAIIHGDAAEKRRLERELYQASEIQRVLLPQSAPELSDYDVAADYIAARIVSGDYYDYIRVDDDRYGIAIGDVCGKGIAASLIMAMCRSNLRSRAPENLSPASVLHAVNRSIFPDITGDKFVSLLYLIAERGSNEITMARAGHEPPILFRKETGKIEVLEPPGLAAGIDEGPVFKRAVKDHRFKIYPGDILVLYTDGINECENRDGDEYGIDRLCDVIRSNSELSSQSLVETIIGDVKNFSDGMAQIDDITLIAIEKR